MFYVLPNADNNWLITTTTMTNCVIVALNEAYKCQLF